MCPEFFLSTYPPPKKLPVDATESEGGRAAEGGVLKSRKSRCTLTAGGNDPPPSEPNYIGSKSAWMD